MNLSFNLITLCYLFSWLRLFALICYAHRFLVYLIGSEAHLDFVYLIFLTKVSISLIPRKIKSTRRISSVRYITHPPGLCDADHTNYKKVTISLWYWRYNMHSQTATICVPYLVLFLFRLFRIRNYSLLRCCSTLRLVQTMCVLLSIIVISIIVISLIVIILTRFEWSWTIVPDWIL